MLDSALAKKPDEYKIWLSKQHTGFCGTRLQVSYHKILKGEQVWCPKSGRVEIEAHLSACAQITTDQNCFWKQLMYYSWIGCPVWTHKTSICRKTKRATTDLNIRMKIFEK